MTLKGSWEGKERINPTGQFIRILVTFSLELVAVVDSCRTGHKLGFVAPSARTQLRSSSVPFKLELSMSAKT